MPRTLLLAPHADDETLFAAYLAQRYAAHILVVYDEGRADELERASAWLGCPSTHLGAKKGAAVEDVEEQLWAIRTPYGDDWERVIAPAHASAGHEEHNTVAEVTGRVFDRLPTLRYLTYAPRGNRDREGYQVTPDRWEFVARKLAALSCYRSQIEDPATRPWFYELLDVREWIASAA